MRTKWQAFAALLVVAATVLAACAPLGAGPVEKTVYVGPYLEDCVGIAPQKCMLVKEDLKGDWTLFYDSIEGFDYEEGFEYELLVREEKIQNPPADASSIRWTLVKVVSQQRALEGTTWVLRSYADDQGSLVEVFPGSEVTARFQEGQVGGNASCNSYFGTFTVDGARMTIDIGGATMMMCVPEPLAAQEQAVLRAMGSAGFHLIAGNELRIADTDGRTVLIYDVLQPASLSGTLWELTGYNNGKGGFSSVLAGTEITATFGDNGSITGTAGCNNYAGSYEVEDNRISISPLATTMMFCGEPEGIMDQESAYTAAIESASTFQVEGETLTLYNAEGTRMAAFRVRQPAELTGATWQLTGYNNGKNAVVSVLGGTAITAVFGEDGRVSGSAGCNNYFASYEIDAASISIGPAASTRKMCAQPEGIMEQESAYLAALETAATYQIQGDSLELRAVDGALVASFLAGVEASVPAGGDCPSQEQLANMEYMSEFTQSGVAPLSNGEYREPAAPGSATETVVILTEVSACGELNGQPAAAVVLVTDPGGSGNFYDLAVVEEQGGQPANIATTLLGDRVQISSLTIENNQIVVDMVTHGPDDPMCCPSQQVVQTYALQGDQLEQTSSEVIGTAAGETGLTGIVWQWTQLVDPLTKITVDDPSRYTVEFLADGTVAVKADCNNGRGSYTTEGSSISIEVLAMTRAQCPPDSKSDEFIANLNRAAIHFFEGENLYLDLPMDSGTLEFVPAP